jgi:hypothetical protein
LRKLDDCLPLRLPSGVNGHDRSLNLLNVTSHYFHCSL